MNWIIAVPVYGEEHSRKFFDITLPRISKCLAGFSSFDRKITWVIHTDRADDVNDHIPGAVTVKVNPPLDYQVFVEGHKEAWNRAEEGDRVCFLCADLIPSKTAFFFAEHVLEKGYQAVVAAGIRTYGPPPEEGLDTPELLEYSMKYPHKIVSDTFYGSGGSENPTNIYFRKNDSVILRGFHLHPFVAVKRKSDFRGTVDDDLLQGFKEEEIYVVTNREMALVEMSPLTKSQPCGSKPFQLDDFKKCYDQKAKDWHRFFLKHRIRVLGNEDPGDRESFSNIGLPSL